MGRPDDSRRRFLQQMLIAGATSGTAIAPLSAQEATSNAAAPAAGASIAETLAKFAGSLRYEDLPKEVIRAAKRTILDTIGCAIGSYQAGPPQIAIRLAEGVSATRAATVFCSGARTSLDRAVFANGIMIRYLDFNDAYSTPIGGGHPSDALAALLCSAQINERSGRELIAATALAYEVFCKLSDVLDIKGMGLDQSTVLGVASLVGSAQLLGLSSEQLVNAIGITVGGNTAINQGRVGNLSNWKDFATAEASRKAMFSLEMAQAGMTGPSQIFEGPSGFFNVICHRTFELPKLGEPFGILRAVTKRFPLGQYSQSMAQAASELRSFFKNPADIQTVNIRVSHNAIRVMAGSPDKWKPQNHETADHSMPYAAAVILTYGTIDDHYYDEPYRTDPRLLELVGRVHCLPSEEADMHEKDYNLCDMEIVLKSGQSKTVRVQYQRGHPMNPMTDAEMEEKFRTLGRRHLSAERCDALLRQLWELEAMPRAGMLIEMTKV